MPGTVVSVRGCSLFLGKPQSMKTQNPPENYISVLKAPEGLLIQQGPFQQCLYLRREDAARFIQDPERTRLVVIPKFAALVLGVHFPYGKAEAFEFAQNVAISDDFSLTVRGNSGKGVCYFSNHDSLPGARVLRARGIRVIATPRLTASITTDQPEPRLSVIAELPVPEEPDYAGRFVHPTRLLSEAVARSLARTSNQSSHEY